MKIRKQTYSLEQYLKLMNTETIRTDQECQRLSGQWTPNMVNELIATVLTDNYIPPIILGEETVNGIATAGFMFLILLMIIVLYNDIVALAMHKI